MNRQCGNKYHLGRNGCTMGNMMFQVSTLQALVAGYTRSVITVQELEGRAASVWEPTRAWTAK